MAFILGEFVELMKKCNKARDYTEMDTAIREKLTRYLYNGGEGKWVPASEIVHVRNCIRQGIPVTPPPAKSQAEKNGTKAKEDYHGMTRILSITSVRLQIAVGIG